MHKSSQASFAPDFCPHTPQNPIRIIKAPILPAQLETARAEARILEPEAVNLKLTPEARAIKDF